MEGLLEGAFLEDLEVAACRSPFSTGKSYFRRFQEVSQDIQGGVPVHGAVGEDSRICMEMYCC